MEDHLSNSVKVETGTLNFWYVSVEGSYRGYRYKHKTKISAVEEAARLSKKENQITYVLECIGAEVPELGWIDK